MFIRPTDLLLVIPLRSVGGTDAISSMMAFFVLAMLAYPETQARAYAELDAVVGRTRLPTFADGPNLPYIRAIVKELLRWRPAAPLPAPHRTIEDDWYEGLFIPKGTICIPNLWHMNRDPEIFGSNTEHFDPGRYLDAHGELAGGVSDLRKEGHFAYGFGSRNCVGRHAADNSLFINIAVLLWAMKIERKKDASGRLLPLDVKGLVGGGLIVLVTVIPSAMCVLTVSFLQASGPVRVRDRSALSGGSCHACTGTRAAGIMRVRLHTWGKKLERIYDSIILYYL